MKDKRWESSSMVIGGTCLVVLGISVMIMRATFAITMIELIATLLIVAGVFQLVALVIGSNDIKKSISLTTAMGSIVAGELIQLFPQIPVSLIVILFGIYGVMTGLLKLITYFIYRKDHVKGRFFLLLDALLFIGLGSSLILTPFARVGQLFFLLGLYAVSLGYTYVRDGLELIIPKATKTKYKRMIRINLPIFLVALLPYRSLQAINKYLGDYDDDGEVTEIVEKKEEVIPDIEVFIHVTQNGYGALGHVDLYFNHEIISYGNYDQDSFKLNESIGDGILFTTSKEKYIPFCIEHSKKTLFSYGLKLDDEQYKNVKAKIDELKARLVPWNPPITKDPEHPEKYQDYGSLLVKDCNAKLYKFKYSRFKTYFVMSTNCVLLADSVLGKAGTDLLNINGMITPGTYYDYFEREFKKEGSFVVTRTVYK